MFKIKKNLIKKIIARTLALFLLLTIILPVLPRQVYAGSNTEEKSYIVKLNSSEDKNILENNFKNVNQLFSWQTGSEFKNIYKFTTSLDPNYYLQGKYYYLEQNTQFKESTIALNDPGFTQNSQDIDKQWYLLKSGFVKAWETTIGTKNNVVAIIDTGIDQTHQDLRSVNYVGGFDFLIQRDIKSGSNSDDNGHGTLVSGILGATVNNGIGISGANWQISLMPLKALDSNGKGDASALAQAIVWAADHGAGFINLSVGGIGAGHDTTLTQAIVYAFNKNVVIVAAAGNDLNKTGDDLDQTPVYPICDDNNTNMIIGVTATDQNDLKADFANYGKSCIDVSAPGKRILSTINHDPVTKSQEGSAYAYASGTSLAVPLVVAQAALIKSVYPNATNVQIRDKIISTADKIDNLNLFQCGGKPCAGLIGSGRINVSKSVMGELSAAFSEGDLVKLTDRPGVIYQVVGGQKRLVSTFVYNQRFLNSSFKTAVYQDLAYLPEGSYVTPNEGTLIKLNSSPAVYYMQSGKKMPVSKTIFDQRSFNFNEVSTVSVDEFNSWTTGSFLPPIEGTVVKTPRSPTIYWVVGQVIHPVNSQFYKEKGLNIFKILTVSENDIKGFASGEAYVR